ETAAQPTMPRTIIKNRFISGCEIRPGRRQAMFGLAPDSNRRLRCSQWQHREYQLLPTSSIDPCARIDMGYLPHERRIGNASRNSTLDSPDAHGHIRYP